MFKFVLAGALALGAITTTTIADALPIARGARAIAEQSARVTPAQVPMPTPRPNFKVETEGKAAK